MTDPGVLSIFQREFVRTDQLPRHLGRFYQELFDLRRESDYEDLVWFEADLVRPLMGQAREFVDVVAAQLAELTGGDPADRAANGNEEE